MIDRAALRALCDAATPGPWRATADEQSTGQWYQFWSVYYQSGTKWFDLASDYNEPTAQFVAAARTAIPDLLDALDARDAELTDATNRIETLTHQLNAAQREAVRIELRQEDRDQDARLLVQLWNAMVRTETGWTITIDRGLDTDLLRAFEQAVLNE